MEQLAYETIFAALGAHQLPVWEELPDFELYMDQVLSLVGRYLHILPGSEERPLTSSMVNNYVKLKVLPPPVSKKYSRAHIARLLVICTLKRVLPIAQIQTLLREVEDEAQMAAFYGTFRRLYGETNRELAASAQPCGGCEQVLRAALRAQAQQAAALALCEAGEAQP